MIYTNLNNSGEVEAVYAAKRVTATGAPPLSYPSKGYDLEDFLISGNTVQDGMPTPSDPVDVVGCGERTKNLFDYRKLVPGYTYGPDGQMILNPDEVYRWSFAAVPLIEVEPGATYLRTYNLSPWGNIINFYDSNKNFLEQVTSGSVTTVPSNCNFVSFVFRIEGFDVEKYMFTKGSTPPETYEPYGYKLPLAVNGTEYPIYLGQVPTTRRIKKLVLTGEETTWTRISSAGRNIFYNTSITPDYLRSSDVTLLCTHYVAMANVERAAEVEDGKCALFKPIGVNQRLYIADSDFESVDAFKSYLAAQYAAGTPVTVWYVLATEETAVANEPLHKIGDYADIISLSQSGITVPTTAGTNTITTETTVLPSSISVTTPEKEVEEIYAGINYQNPIYYKSRTLTGTLPLTYKALSKPLTDYVITGNLMQNGTPSPEAPVEVLGCGVRTGNLLYKKIESCSISSGGAITANESFYVAIAKVVQGETYSTVETYMAFYTVEPTTGSISYDSSRIVASTFVAPITGYVAVRYPSNYSNEMLNEGSAPLPYEPYGYKLPLTVNGTEYPIYLGQVPTTRQIKKLVVDGTETWGVSELDGKYRFNLPTSTFEGMPDTAVLSTHFAFGGFDAIHGEDGEITGTSSPSAFRVYFWTTLYSTTDTWKTYLQQQYAAGTPVTVWYVLAEPETGIVNEPLMKIGDYADTISYAQADVTIPTVSGANVLEITSPVKPLAISITDNIKPTGYEQLLDVNNVDIQDKNNTPIFIHE